MVKEPSRAAVVNNLLGWLLAWWKQYLRARLSPVPDAELLKNSGSDPSKVGWAVLDHPCILLLPNWPNKNDESVHTTSLFLVHYKNRTFAHFLPHSKKHCSRRKQTDGPHLAIFGRCKALHSASTHQEAPQEQYEAMSFSVLLLSQGSKRLDCSDIYKITLEESAFCIAGLNS